MEPQTNRIDTVVRGGLVVTSANAFKADIAILDGKIAAIGSGATFPPASRHIDATRKVVFPGFIDCHCHFPGWEDYELAGKMAASSGLTTIIPFGITDSANAEGLPDAVSATGTR
jgi:dihydroorotase-like cyclic amidohydrolase